MKIVLISAACAIFIFGTACAREVAAGPTFILHGESVIAVRRVAQINRTPREVIEPCTTKFITTSRSEGAVTTRESVDCEE
jgi:glutamine phosphoribosylpyrophosphate amidotransferase